MSEDIEVTKRGRFRRVAVFIGPESGTDATELQIAALSGLSSLAIAATPDTAALEMSSDYLSDTDV